LVQSLSASIVPLTIFSAPQSAQEIDEKELEEDDEDEDCDELLCELDEDDD